MHLLMLHPEIQQHTRLQLLRMRKQALQPTAHMLLLLQPQNQTYNQFHEELFWRTVCERNEK
jgi:hypothetical protein